MYGRPAGWRVLADRARLGRPGSRLPLRASVAGQDGGISCRPPAYSRQQRSSSFPRPIRSHAHRCSHLTRQHGGEQSGLVTLTFDLLTLTAVSESRVMWATSMPILVFLGLSVLDLGPMCAIDRRQTDVRQKHHLMPRLLGRRRRRFRIDTEVRCVGVHPPFGPLEPTMVKPN